MGRAFEYRKATKLKRWGHMARTFTKIGKQITIAVREGGPEPENNPHVRSIFNKFSGNLGTMGSLAFLFDHKCVFSFHKKDGLDMDSLILDLIDYGVDDEYDTDDEENSITIYGDPKSFGQIQQYLEEHGLDVIGAEFTYIPNDLKDVTPEERESIDKMVGMLEDFDDVQNVYTNMKPEESAEA